MRPAEWNKYLSRRPEAAVEPAAVGPAACFAVIPACDEWEELAGVLASLREARGIGEIPVVVVINHPAGAPERLVTASARLLEAFRRREWTLPRLYWIYAPGLEGGVGAARKLGMDRVLDAISAAEAERAVICSLDADSPVEPDYFERVREFFAARTEREAGAAVIGFRHRAGESAEQESAIRAYERYLDRYAEKLTRAGSPYGFRTVGSAFAVRASTYVRCGGMRVRTAGEDFYFLQAAAKVAPMGRMDEVLVHPSPRCSERVPFGTGRSVRSILEGGTLREIPDEAFDGLRELLRWASDPVRLASVSEVPDRARAFLEREGFFEIWPKVLRNTPPREEARAAAFHRWFDGLRTLRYLHFLAGWR